MNEQQKRFKINYVFWLVMFASQFALCIVFQAVAKHFHMQANVGSTPVLSFLIATLVGRKCGLSLEERKTTELTGFVELKKSAFSHDAVAIYSTLMDSKSSWFGVLGCLFMAGVFAFAAFVVAPNWVIGKTIASTMVGALLLGAFYFYKKGHSVSLIVKVDEKQITSRGWLGTYQTVHWKDVVRCEIVEGKTIFGETYTNVHVHGKFTMPTDMTNVSSATLEQRDALFAYLKQHFSVHRVLN